MSDQAHGTAANIARDEEAAAMMAFDPRWKGHPSSPGARTWVVLSLFGLSLTRRAVIQT